MCVVENKTYVYEGNRREIRRMEYRCHNAPAGGLCAYVEQRNTAAARVVERRPDADQSSLPTSRNTVVANGREYRYFPLSRRSSQRSSGGRRDSNDGNQSPRDSLVSSSPSRVPTHRTVRPTAPSPPPAPRTSRRVSFHEPPSDRRLEALDGTAIYSGPPSLNMPRAHDNERHSLDHKSSISSLTNEVDNTEPPRRRSSMKRPRRPSGLDLGLDSTNAIPSSQSSPGLSDLPRVYRDRPDSATGVSIPQRSQDESRHEEEARQARLVRDSIAATNERQRARQSREQQDAAQKYIDDSSREPSPEYRASHRRATEAQLTGEPTSAARQQDLHREMDRRVEAELARVAREKYEAEQRRRPDPPRIAPPARAYTHLPSSPAGPSRISARKMTDTSPTLSARTPRYGPALVSQPNPPRNPMAEQGERVINRTQAMSESLNDMMRRSQLEEYESYDDSMQSVADSGTSSSRTRYKREERRRKRQGYND